MLACDDESDEEKTELANQCGSSSAMEFEGHQQAFTFLLATDMVIKTFISDRHMSIGKWMRVDCPKKCKDLGKPVIDHFFDLWHIGKKIQKILIKLSKEKGCEAIGRWRKACVRHFYWAVTSTTPKLGDVIVAKFNAFFYHIINVHNDIPNRLFNKCAHATLTVPRLWLTKGSEAYWKLYDALTQTSLVKAMKQASPVAQTSSLEGYHSVINQFAPKMLAFSYLGMLSRTILSALHFNYNANRESKVDVHGKTKLTVTYPKFKGGDATSDGT
ncbi:hypothetical protein QZH41_019935 [Actinostola sp. cb2023]|nr:hypothetical protein QZH41_019935 [Actinostola sp. cb2023]